VVDEVARFAWYELMTTDIASAEAFYGRILGWGSQDASAPDLPYILATAGGAAVGGLMGLPPEAIKKGATPRWMGYVAVDDVDVVTSRFERLGGTVYVLPTNTNIGRISVVADPQAATLGLVTGLKPARQSSTGFDGPGRVGWHELLAEDWKKAFGFYSEIFGWQKADEIGMTEAYQQFSAGAQIMGGMSTKRPEEPLPFWLFYFNVDDIDAAMERVKAAGGQILDGPYELPDGGRIVRCRDPQGAGFALQGKPSEGATVRPSSDVRWSSAWGGFSSRGRLRVTRPG
jgi:predicted enzyme related to lactoylglutathione lyase